MNLGANDKKKVGILAGLTLVAGYVFYSNVLSGPTDYTPSVPKTSRVVPDAEPAPAAPSPSSAPSGAPKRAGASRSSRSEEFNPVLHSKKSEDRIDPAKVDPTLMLDKLAKLQELEPTQNGRNLFQFGAPPPKEPVKLAGNEPVMKPKGPFVGPMPAPPPPPKVTPVEPPPTPIPYKYYGYTTARNNGKKTAFFLDGEEILIAAEGDTVKRKYRVVRIGNTSVVMEDVDSKKQQTLPMTEEGSAS
jgi:hypothetical protein